MNKGNDVNIRIHGIDLMEAVRYITTKNNRYIAITLQEIENILGAGNPDMIKIRKHVLDGFNNYTRSLGKLFLKDVED